MNKGFGAYLVDVALNRQVEGPVRVQPDNERGERLEHSREDPAGHTPSSRTKAGTENPGQQLNDVQSHDGQIKPNHPVSQVPHRMAFVKKALEPRRDAVDHVRADRPHVSFNPSNLKLAKLLRQANYKRNLRHHDERNELADQATDRQQAQQLVASPEVPHNAEAGGAADHDRTEQTVDADRLAEYRIDRGRLEIA